MRLLRSRFSKQDHCDTLSIIVDRESISEKPNTLCSLQLCKPRKKRSNRAMNNARRVRLGNVMATSKWLKNQITAKLSGKSKTSKIPSLSTGSFDEYFLTSV